jgi:DedD protein
VNEILKQRLVGALILVALGVVFWPIIFVEPGAPGDATPGRMPSQPEIDTTPIAAPDPSGWRASTEPYDDQAIGLEQETVAEMEIAEPAEETDASEPVAATSPPVRDAAPVSPALDDKGVPIAWSIQVATVSSAAKAGELRDSLLAMQEQAYIRKLERGDKDLYRVYVGPRFERAQLERVQSSIDKRFGVKSLIVRYLP